MRLLVLAALLVLSPAARAGDPPKIVTKVFSVADLVTPIPDATPSAADKVKAQSPADGAAKLLRTIQTMVRPLSWDCQGGTGNLEFFDLGSALVVKNSPEVVKEVSDLLAALRKLQDTNVVTEVCVMSVAPGFREYLGDKGRDGAVLSEREASTILEMAKADRRGTIMQAPKVTTLDGQVATVRVGEEQMFVTGIDAMRLKGQAIFVGRNTPVHIGDAVTLCGRVGGDGKTVTLRVNLTRTQVAGTVDLVPVVTQITPVFEGGSQGVPVPFTQYLQTPEFKTYTAERTATVPSCGTVVVGGWKETRTAEFGPPTLSKIPYMNRLFKNVGPAEEREVMVLATTRVVTPGDAEVPAVAQPLVARPVAVRPVRTMPGDVNVPVRTQQLAYGGETAPTPTAKQVQLDVVFAAVPADFMTKIGLPVAAKAPRTWTLAGRECDMFSAALRNSPDRKLLSEPRVVTPDGHAASFRVGGTMHLTTGLDVSLKNGDTHVVPRTTVVDSGASATVTPHVSADGKFVRLHLAARQATNLDAPAKRQVVIPAAGEKGKPLAVELEELPKQDIQSLDLAFAVPESGTVVVGGLVSKTAGGKETELLLVLTPRVVKPAVLAPVVTPVTPAGAKLPGLKYDW